jgi:hypothetical protein
VILPVSIPRLVGIPGITSPTPRGYTLAQGAAFREGNFVQQIQTGTAATPAPTGALAAVAGPLPSAVTLSTVASAGAPAATYYVIVTYTAAGTESLPSQEFIVNAQPGFLPQVNVAVAGAPAGATNYAAYFSLYSGMEQLQQATRTTTALGTAFEAANPLANSVGINLAPTNASTLIVGIAAHDSAALYALGVGGSATAGGPGNLLGTYPNPPPLGLGDPQQAVVDRIVDQPIVISLKQPWYGSLIGTTAGILLDAASGNHLLDNTQSNLIFRIQAKVTGAQTDVGSVGDTNALVQAIAISGVI